MSNNRIIQPAELRTLTVKMEIPEIVMQQWHSNNQQLARRCETMEVIMSRQQQAICALVMLLGGKVEIAAGDMETAEEVLQGRDGLGLFTYRNTRGDVKLVVGPRVDEEESDNGHERSDVPGDEGELPQPPEGVGGAEGASPPVAGQLEADSEPRGAEVRPAG